MIAQRFRPVGWVASVATAATILYLISLQVATERGRLEAIDAKIASAKRDIRHLQTEMGTRASLRQLERWNGEVLALSAPQAQQFLRSEGALATLDHGAIGRALGGVVPPPAIMASADQQAQAQAASKPTILTQIVDVAATPKPVKMTQQDRALQHAIAPKKPKVERIAVLDGAMLDRQTLGDLARAADREITPKAKARP